MPTVALGSDFLDAYARIPRAQQKKVREFTEKFKANPKSPGIHYEKIHDVRGDKVRTVRIDQKYRAVVLCPNHGDPAFSKDAEEHVNHIEGRNGLQLVDR